MKRALYHLLFFLLNKLKFWHTLFRIHVQGKFIELGGILISSNNFMNEYSKMHLLGGAAHQFKIEMFKTWIIFDQKKYTLMPKVCQYLFLFSLCISLKTSLILKTFSDVIFHQIFKKFILIKQCRFIYLHFCVWQKIDLLYRQNYIKPVRKSF